MDETEIRELSVRRAGPWGFFTRTWLYDLWCCGEPFCDEIRVTNVHPVSPRCGIHGTSMVEYSRVFHTREGSLYRTRGAWRRH